MSKTIKLLALLMCLALVFPMLVACTDTETEPPTQTESTSESVSVTESDSASEPESKTESETITESQAESATESETLTESQTESATESETLTESQTESATESETLTESQTESATESETLTESQTESATESETITESQTESTTKSETVTETQTESETQRDYTSEPLDNIMQNMFSGNVMYNETVMFLDYGQTKSLMFNIDEMISVTSYDNKITYTEGVDYAITDGKLTILEGSSIPCITSEQYYNVSNTMLQTNHNGANVNTYWGEGATMTQWQVNVTYRHSDEWSGFAQECNSDRFSALISKLEAGEDVTIAFYGDSITVGANASDFIGIDPHQFSYPLLICDTLARIYGYSVIHQTHPGMADSAPKVSYGERGKMYYLNSSVGGWSSINGVSSFSNSRPSMSMLLESYGCDLFVVAFGMNDANLHPQTTADNIRSIIEAAVAIAPDAATMIVSTMVPNPNATNGWYGYQYKQDQFLSILAEELNEGGVPCALVNMTAMSLSILEHKEFMDYTGNNINHPNDFFGRVYAQALLQCLLGYDYIDSHY